MKNNITFIALNKSLKENIIKDLAQKTKMFYVDINELINYELLNINKIISVAGLEYYNNIVSKKVKLVSTYENSIITLDLDAFFLNDNYKFLKQSSKIIYLRVDYENYKKFLDEEIPPKTNLEKSLNKKIFFERDKILSSLCDKIIDFTTKEEVIDLIKNKINEI